MEARREGGELAKAVLAGELCYAGNFRRAEMSEISSKAPPGGRIVGGTPNFREVAELPQHCKEGIRRHPDTTPARVFGTVLGIRSQAAIGLLSAWRGEPVNRRRMRGDSAQWLWLCFPSWCTSHPCERRPHSTHRRNMAPDSQLTL